MRWFIGIGTAIAFVWMGAALAGHNYLGVGILSAWVLGGLITLASMGTRPTEPERWAIQVAAPKQLVEPQRLVVAGSYGAVTETVNKVDQNQDLIVRLAKGKQRINLGVVRVNEENFDERVQELLSEAMDRQTTLNALDDYEGVDLLD